MYLNHTEKNDIKRRIVESLRTQQEVDRIVIFGSFLENDNPNDIDLAVFQNSNESYLTLSVKYRRIMHDISKSIPVDVIPLVNGRTNDFILSEIESGETIYERRY